MLASLQIFFIIAASLTAGVFVCALRFALQEARSYRNSPNDPEVPLAELHNTRLFSHNPWHRGSAKQRLIRSIYYLQATIVALAITSVFVMFLCMAGVITSVLVGSL